MALKRILPCLLFDGSGLVKTEKFRRPSYVGDPINAIKIFNDKEVDELVVLNINASRDGREPDFDRISDMAGEAFMPFSYGGGVKTYEHFARLYKLGVEKVIVNSLLQENPGIVSRVVADYGAQAVVACVDFKRSMFGKVKPYSYRGHRIDRTLEEYVRYLSVDIGVGEILLQSVDGDGTWQGYDFKVTEEIAHAIDVPVIACGGCGSVDDIRKVLFDSGAQAAAIGSMAVYSKKGMGVLINFPEREFLIPE